MEISALEKLYSRRRFGMKPGLETVSRLLSALGDPHLRVRAVHVAGTNGKGAVCAILDSCLRAAGFRCGRYTSPHLVRINERFFLDGRPAPDSVLERHASAVASAWPGGGLGGNGQEPTFFEALTAVAFLLYADAAPDWTILETGLGGRLDATNVCRPRLCVVTRIGLDHCDWLGHTLREIASEKAGIVKPGVPVVLGENAPEVRAVVEARARELSAPFVYAPDVASARDIPPAFALHGRFNAENAVTAIAALKTLLPPDTAASAMDGFSSVVWPGRFQRVGRFIVDGAHNPPAATALAASLAAEDGISASGFLAAEDDASAPAGSVDGNRVEKGGRLLVAGFCGDKDVRETLRILRPFVSSAIAVKTGNPRSMEAAELASVMAECGIPAVPAPSLAAALADASSRPGVPVLVCGSLFLAGEALVLLGAYLWPANRFDPSELLRGAEGTPRPTKPPKDIGLQTSDDILLAPHGAEGTPRPTITSQLLTPNSIPQLLTPNS